MPNLEDNPSGEFTIDFGALQQKASEMLDAVAEAPAPAEKPAEPDPTEVRVKGAGQAEPPAEKEAPEEPAEADAVKEPRTLELNDDDLVKVVVDGETVLRPWKEVKGVASGEFKFTKSMQQLAKEREALKAEQAKQAQLTADLESLRTERAQIASFLKDRNQVAAFIQQMYPDMLSPEQVKAAVEGPDLNEIATIGDVRTVAEREIAKFQTLLKTTEERLAQRLEANQKEAQEKEALAARQKEEHAYREKISTTLTEIFTSYPVLKDIPGIEFALRQQVFDMAPETEADAINAFRQVAQEMVSGLQKHNTNSKKLQAIAEKKAKLESKSIEPPGGTPPQQKPVEFKDANGQVDWKKVQAAALAALG